MPPVISGSLHEILHSIVPQTPRAQVRPYRLIVAWHGVLTLAFEAWPKQLTQLKQRINEEPEFRSLSENFGTRWPKLTLAARNDDAPPMTIDQLRELTALCGQFEARLENLAAVPLSHCSVVLFASRSLSHCLCRMDYAFMKEDSSLSQSSNNNHNQQQDYDADSYEIVQSVVRETMEEPLDDYLPKVNADGHRWGEHYNTTWTEATLVCFLANNEEDEQEVSVSSSPPSISLLELLTSFRERVDALLPGVYTWMPQESLHLSLRSLENRSNLPREGNSDE